MRYEEYIKTPEAVWFSSVPADWRATKMREVFSERNAKVSDKDYPALSVGKLGVTPQLDTAVKTDNGDNRKLICKGDFAINSRSDRKGSSGISQYDGSASLIITVLKPHHELNGRFYHYLLRSHYFVEEFYRNGHGLVSDLWTTKWDEMRNIYIPVPPREEQDQIVRYLDWKVSCINKLIHGYQRQIKLLEERYTSMVTEAVVHGIDEDAHLVDVNIQGFDRIPDTWKVVQNKRIFRERSEVSKTGNETLLSVSKRFGVKPYNELEESERLATIKPADSLVGYKKVSVGNLAMNIMRARNGSYGISDYEGIVSPAYCVYELVMPTDSRYIHYLLKTPQVISLFEAYSYGICEHRRRLYAPDFLRLYLPIPPVEEQKEIADYIAVEEKRKHNLIKQLEKQISLLREYRTRLISDVVTGQMDVRSIFIPDYTPEDDTEENEADEETTDEEVNMDAD